MVAASALVAPRDSRLSRRVRSHSGSGTILTVAESCDYTRRGPGEPGLSHSCVCLCASRLTILRVASPCSVRRPPPSPSSLSDIPLALLPLLSRAIPPPSAPTLFLNHSLCRVVCRGRARTRERERENAARSFASVLSGSHGIIHRYHRSSLRIIRDARSSGSIKVLLRLNANERVR